MTAETASRRGPTGFAKSSSPLVRSRPLPLRRALIWSGVRLGLACNMSATVPATFGVAPEVPPKPLTYLGPAGVDGGAHVRSWSTSPGAQRVTRGPQLLNPARAFFESSYWVAPTMIAFEPGWT